MPIQKLCKGGCGRSILVWNTIQNKCDKCSTTKPIPKKGKPVTNKCKVCQKEYKRRPSIAARSKYCSVACRDKGRSNQEVRKCKNCYQEFSFKPSQLNAYKNAGRYCSRKCRYEYDVKVNANAPIKDKYGRSGRKADKEWQKAVRERDEFICQRCGKYDQYIHTHHIALRSQRPDLKHEVSNGVCLCASCHQWVHHHPKLAKEQGFISDAKYGVKQMELRSASISKSKDQGKTKEFSCMFCGKKKYYSGATANRISKSYRCIDCYMSTHIKRKASL